MILLPQKLPSFQERRFDIPKREHFIATNGSITQHNGVLYVAVNAIDHFLNEGGFFIPLKPDYDPADAAFNLTYLARLNDDLSVASCVELSHPETIETPWQFRGFECPRIFSWRGSLHIAACSSGTGADPGATFHMGRIDGDKIVDVCRLTSSYYSRTEKNWMPEVVGDDLRFHYRLGVVVTPDGETRQTGGRDDMGSLHGGSQVIPYEGGGLCVVHQYRKVPGSHRKRSRQHFVRTGRDGAPAGMSQAVVFGGSGGCEVTTGMAYHPDGKRLVVSYGRDKADHATPHQERPYLASFNLNEFAGRIV